MKIEVKKEKLVLNREYEPETLKDIVQLRTIEITG